MKSDDKSISIVIELCKKFQQRYGVDDNVKTILLKSMLIEHIIFGREPSDAYNMIVHFYVQLDHGYEKYLQTKLTETVNKVKHFLNVIYFFSKEESEAKKLIEDILNQDHFASGLEMKKQIDAIINAKE
jgi:uncharacterized protein YutE (UPF0331/DUF86 family)